MTFDPYHKWLGIAPQEQPPNHYRLLAIQIFESDPEVIDAAANRQMAYLQQRATGEHAALSQKLLNEVAAARVCLLNPNKKAEYDADQRTRLAKSGPTAGTPSADLTSMEPDWLSEVPPTPSALLPVRQAHGRRFLRLEPWQYAVAAGVTFLVLLGAWAVLPSGDKSKQQVIVAEADQPPPPPPERKSALVSSSPVIRPRDEPPRYRAERKGASPDGKSFSVPNAEKMTLSVETKSPQPPDKPPEVKPDDNPPAIFSVTITPASAKLLANAAKATITGSGRHRQIRIEKPRDGNECLFVVALCEGYVSKAKLLRFTRGVKQDLPISLNARRSPTGGSGEQKVAAWAPILSVGGKAIDWWLSSAVKEARDINDAKARDSATASVVWLLAALGDFEEARARTLAISDSAAKASALANLSFGRAKDGDFSAAMTEAAGIVNFYLRATAIARIGNCQVRQNDLTGAQGTYLAARKLAQSIPDRKTSAGALFAVADYQAREDKDEAGKTLSEAVTAALAVSDVNPRSMFLDRAARAWADIGNFDAAISTANSIDAKATPWFADWAFVHIATQMAKANNTAGAYQLVRRISTPNQRKRVQVTIATCEASGGDFSKAISRVRTMPDSQERVLVFCELVDAQIGVGHYREAEQTLREALSAAMRLTGDSKDIGLSRVLGTHLSLVQKQHGDWQSVRSLVSSFQAERSRQTALAQVARTQTTANDVEEAKLTLASIGDHSIRSAVIPTIAKAQSRSPQDAGVLEWIESLETPRDRFYAYLGVAQSFLPDEN